MINKANLILGISAGAIVLAFSFQNCSKHGFRTESSSVDLPSVDPINNDVQALRGACGSAQGYYDAQETSFHGSLCFSGRPLPASTILPQPGSQSTYECQGKNETVQCFLGRAPGPGDTVKGECGLAQGTYRSTDTTYRMPLCAGGIASPLNPIFPPVGQSATYHCVGSNNGSSVSCTMTREATNSGPQDAICGLAEGRYAFDATSFRPEFCKVGTLLSSPMSSPSFPAQGSTITYECLGVNNGITKTCSVSRDSAPPGSKIDGTCGAGAGSYSQAESTFRLPLCSSQGQPSAPSFPGPGGTASYSCPGSGGGIPAVCTATRQATAACTLPNYEYYNSSNLIVCGQCPADKSYHSNSKTCVNHNFSAVIENYSSNLGTFRADFKIDIESEHMNDSTKEWAFLAAAYTFPNGSIIWKLYDQAGKEWKDYPANVVGTQLPSTPTSYPYLLLNVPTMDATSLGGWQLKVGYGRGDTLGDAFGEMLSAGRASSLVTIDTQPYSATVTGIPAAAVFTAPSYDISFAINPASSEYANDEFNYYVFFQFAKGVQVPADSGGPVPAETITKVLTMKLEGGKYVAGDWVVIEPINGAWVRKSDGTPAPATLKVSDLKVTKPSTYNLNIVFPAFSAVTLAQFRGMEFRSSYGKDYSDALKRWENSPENNPSKGAQIPLCPDKSKTTVTCQ